MEVTVGYLSCRYIHAFFEVTADGLHVLLQYAFCLLLRIPMNFSQVGIKYVHVDVICLVIYIFTGPYAHDS